MQTVVAGCGAASPGSSLTMASVLERQLREDIVAARLRPGAKLNLRQLGTHYGAGQNPLREALSRLVSDGLVTALDHKGFRVAPMSRRELEELTQLRGQLETTALRLSIQHGGSEWEAQLLAANHRLQSTPYCADAVPDPADDIWERQHSALHQALSAGCNSPWLMRLCRLMFDQTTRYRRLFMRTESIRGRPLNLFRAHGQIVEAALDRDADAACRALLGNVIQPGDLFPDDSMLAGKISKMADFWRGYLETQCSTDR